VRDATTEKRHAAAAALLQSMLLSRCSSYYCRYSFIAHNRPPSAEPWVVLRCVPTPATPATTTGKAVGDRRPNIIRSTRVRLRRRLLLATVSRPQMLLLPKRIYSRIHSCGAEPLMQPRAIYIASLVKSVHTTLQATCTWRLSVFKAGLYISIRYM